MNDTNPNKQEVLQQQVKAQEARFNLALTWANGLDLEYAGVDVATPMAYALSGNLNVLALRTAQANIAQAATNGG